VARTHCARQASQAYRERIDIARMATQNLMLKPSILDIDDIPSHIATLLAAQRTIKNDTRWPRGLSWNSSKRTKSNKTCSKQREITQEQQDLLENNDKLLHEQEDLPHEREQLLAMSPRQLGKIQALEKQLQAVGGHPRVIKQMPAFIQIPDTKANYKHFQLIEIVNTYPDLQNSQTSNGNLLKSKK